MLTGVDGAGNWLGLRFENARFPQLLTLPGGLAVAPRFCEVAAGDVSGEGFADLYFSDYDGTETGIPEAVNAYYQIAACYRRTGRPSDARGTIEQAKVILSRIPSDDAAFVTTTSYTRQEWQKLLDWMAKL